MEFYRLTRIDRELLEFFHQFLMAATSHSQRDVINAEQLSDNIWSNILTRIHHVENMPTPIERWMPTLG